MVWVTFYADEKHHLIINYLLKVTLLFYFINFIIPLQIEYVIVFNYQKSL